MRYISDPERVSQLLDHFQISRLFSTPGLRFSLVEYQPGESLTSPNQEPTALLFLVSGTIAIRSIRSDGSEYLLTVGSRFSMLGDVEFATGRFPAFWAQASTVVQALRLPLAPYQEALQQDIPFLHFLLTSLAEKLDQSSHSEASAASLEQRLFQLMDWRCPSGILTGIGETAALLHCSTRQLQRVLKHCTEVGTMKRLGKGIYQRTDR